MICSEEGTLVLGPDPWASFSVSVIGCEPCAAPALTTGAPGRSMVLGWGGINLADLPSWSAKSVKGVSSLVCIMVEGRSDTSNPDCGSRKSLSDGHRAEVGLGILALPNKPRDSSDLAPINLGWEGSNKKVLLAGPRFVTCSWALSIFLASLHWYKISSSGGGAEWGWRWVKLSVSCIGAGFEGAWNGASLGGFSLGASRWALLDGMGRSVEDVSSVLSL